MSVALLVIDFINDIAHPQGKIARSAERIANNNVIERANEVIAWMRQKNALIIFVKVGFHSGYPDCPQASPLFGAAIKNEALLLDTWGTTFHEKLAWQDSDLVIVKPRVSAFYATPLEAVLRAQKIKSLLLTGTATNMAVEHTARDAHDRDYLVTIVQDACETASEESQVASLASMARIAKVLSTAELLKG